MSNINNYSGSDTKRSQAHIEYRAEFMQELISKSTKGEVGILLAMHHLATHSKQIDYILARFGYSVSGAHELIKIGESFFIAENLQQFKGLNKDTADKLIDAGEAKSVVENLERFPGLDKETLNKLIDVSFEFDQGMGEVILYVRKLAMENLQRFKGLDKETAHKLIDSGYAKLVVENISIFQGLDKETVNKLIDKFIKTGEIEYFIDNLHFFFGMGVNDVEILTKLIGNGGAEYVAQNPQKFTGIHHIKLAYKLIENGEGKYVVKNLDKFKGIHHIKLAYKLIENGDGKYVIKDLQKFKLLDVEIAGMLINEGYAVEVEINIEKFQS